MGKCKWCGKTGLFLKVSSNGLCNNCEGPVALDIQQRARIAGESLKLVQESKNLEIRLSRLKEMLKHLYVLTKYEEKGIPTIDPLPSVIYKEFYYKNDQIVIEHIETEVEKARKKNETAATVKTKKGNIIKVIQKIEDYREKMDKSEKLNGIINKLKTEAHDIEVAGYLEEADKAAFKGKKPKALDNYYEALYLLRTDDIDDEKQEKQIKEIEKKIVALGGKIPEKIVDRVDESICLQDLSEPKAPESTFYTLRQGKSVIVDDAFKAWTSGDLNEMLGAVDIKTNPIDRHFLLQSIVAETYKTRKDNKSRKICIKYAEKHLKEFASIAPALKEDMGGVLPRITTFQHYATLLTEDGDFEKAIDICKKAIQYDLHDGTKAGFEGRIERIKKQKAKAHSRCPAANTNTRSCSS